MVELMGFTISRGASLFSAKPAVVATLRIPQSEQALFNQYAQQAIATATIILPKIDPALTFGEKHTNRNLFLLQVIVNLSTCLLGKLESHHGYPGISSDKSGEIVHIAYAETNAALVAQIATTAVKVALSLYPDDLSSLIPDNLWTSDPVAFCKEMLVKLKPYVKGRTIREVQLSLNNQGISWFPLDRYSRCGNQIQIGYGRHQKVLNGTTLFESSLTGINISLSKTDTRQFLAELGFPVTRQVPVTSASQAVSVASTMGYPVVVKADKGAFGDGVYPDLRNADDVIAAFNNVATSAIQQNRPGNSVFVENFVPGNDYRLTLVKGKLLNALHRKPASVTADGKRNIRELVALENRNPLRGEKTSDSASFVRLELQEAELATLKKQGMTPESVPEQGQRVLLRSNANWSSGGTIADVGHTVHPDNIALGRRIAAAMHIDIIGVDVITDDIGRSYLEGNLTILEVNHSPGIFSFRDEHGEYIDQGARIVSLVAPRASRQHMPIVLVSRGAGSAEATDALGKLFAMLGFCPGVINHSGMFINGEQWATPETIDSFDPAFTLVRNSEIDAAVIEREGRVALDLGVGTGDCDISVILSTDRGAIATAKWRNGINRSEADRLFIRSARKKSVLWIDDSDVAALGSQFPAPGLCVVSLHGYSQEVDQFVSQGATSVVLESATATGFTLRVDLGGNATSRHLVQAGNIATRQDDTALLPGLASLATMLSLDLGLEKTIRHIEQLWLNA